MAITLEKKAEKQFSGGIALRNDSRDWWARLSGLSGAMIWAGMAVCARAGVVRVGAIELMFLFAPLVIVPLGMELQRMLTSPLLAETARAKWGTQVELIAQRLQPFGAVLAVAALVLPPGRAAGLLACGWLVVCLIEGGSGVIDVATVWSGASRGGRGAFTLAIVVARFDLVVGGAWFVASRLGMHPLGIQEPIGLLTAVHFHFAGFATAMIAAAMLRFARGASQAGWLKWIVPLVIGMPYVVAIGFVVSPAMKMTAAAVFSVSVAALAVLLRSYGSRAGQREARVLLQVASGAVFAGMVLSSVYAIADFAGSNILTIPQMTRTHGILNAMGFCMAGLLGWVTEFQAGAGKPLNAENAEDLSGE